MPPRHKKPRRRNASTNGKSARPHRGRKRRTSSLTVTTHPLQAWMDLHSLTVKDLSAMSGVHKPRISDLLYGRLPAKPKTLDPRVMQLARAMKRSGKDLPFRGIKGMSLEEVRDYILGPLIVFAAIQTAP